MRTRGKTRRSPRGKHPAKPSTSAFWPLGLRDASGPQSGPPGAPRAGAAEQKRHRLAPARVLSGGAERGSQPWTRTRQPASAPAGAAACRAARGCHTCLSPRRPPPTHGPLPLKPDTWAPSSCPPNHVSSRGSDAGARGVARPPPSGPRLAWRLAPRPRRCGHRLSSFSCIPMLFLNLHSVQDCFVLFCFH